MTLFTLNNDKSKLKKTMFLYLGIVAFCILFGFIYENFSHGVISVFMLFGFLFPLVLGLIPYTVLVLFIKGKGPGILSSYLYNAGVATLTVGSYFKGVLDIYGTNRDVYINVYFAVGAILIISGIVIYILSLTKLKEE